MISIQQHLIIQAAKQHKSPTSTKITANFYETQHFLHQLVAINKKGGFCLQFANIIYLHHKGR